MTAGLKNVIVVGGSFVGLAAVKELAALLPVTHRVLLIEPHSHFHHLFAFPRFAIVPEYEHKAFIPYNGFFSTLPNSANHAIVNARVVSLQKNQITLDRPWQGSTEIPFDYAVVATGTRLQAPSNMQHDDKKTSVDYFKTYQQGIKNAKSIVIVGGGAVGVQMATDLGEVYPEKKVTLVHSRDRLMQLYHPKMDAIIRGRLQELGVEGFPNRWFRIRAGAKGRPQDTDKPRHPSNWTNPNSQFLQNLQPTPGHKILNEANGFIKVSPTLQFADPAYSNLYACGDIADSGAHKAARPGAAQAHVVAQNIAAVVQGGKPTNEITVDPPAIHLSLGLTKNMVFRNPPKGQAEPIIMWRDDGARDMKIDGVWERRGTRVTRPDDYHL
ncbi:Apoptosis-inducing factor B [Fusarium culmorum]|uniref:Apoptosis-inducing factor B n=1 Tax=Fusarium culmorum TaxID=5516 RepID=A0A2T4GTR0_FUSCU|nr:Apoptosis-inducing factor B [Fusarium culmorum]